MSGRDAGGRARQPGAAARRRGSAPPAAPAPRGVPRRAAEAPQRLRRVEPSSGAACSAVDRSTTRRRAGVRGGGRAGSARAPPGARAARRRRGRRCRAAASAPAAGAGGGGPAGAGGRRGGGAGDASGGRPAAARRGQGGGGRAVVARARWRGRRPAARRAGASASGRPDGSRSSPASSTRTTPRGQLGPGLAERDAAGLVQVHEVARRARAVRVRARQPLVGDERGRPDVGGARDRAAPHLLRGHVRERAEQAVVDGRVRMVDERDAEVGQLEDAVVAHQHVAGLHVAMHDAARVGVGEGVADGRDRAQDRRVVELARCAARPARSWPSHELEDDVDVVVVLGRVEQPDDRRMVERRGDPHLAPRAPLQPLVAVGSPSARRRPPLASSTASKTVPCRRRRARRGCGSVLRRPPRGTAQGCAGARRPACAVTPLPARCEKGRVVEWRNLSASLATADRFALRCWPSFPSSKSSRSTTSRPRKPNPVDARECPDGRAADGGGGGSSAAAVRACSACYPRRRVLLVAVDRDLADPQRASATRRSARQGLRRRGRTRSPSQSADVGKEFSAAMIQSGRRPTRCCDDRGRDPEAAAAAVHQRAAPRRPGRPWATCSRGSSTPCSTALSGPAGREGRAGAGVLEPEPARTRPCTHDQAARRRDDVAAARGVRRRLRGLLPPAGGHGAAGQGHRGRRGRRLGLPVDERVLELASPKPHAGRAGRRSSAARRRRTPAPTPATDTGSRRTPPTTRGQHGLSLDANVLHPTWRRQRRGPQLSPTS